MTKNQVAQGVADKLFATEESIDVAMVRAAELITAMIEGRRAVGVAATTGEVAQARAAEAIAALSEARRSVMAAHAALANLATKMDADIGAPNKPEEDKKDTGVSLRVA